MMPERHCMWAPKYRYHELVAHTPALSFFSTSARISRAREQATGAGSPSFSRCVSFQYNSAQAVDRSRNCVYKLCSNFN